MSIVTSSTFTKSFPDALYSYILSFLDEKSLGSANRINILFKNLASTDSLWASAAAKASFNAHIDPSTIRPLCISWKQTYAVLHKVQLKKQKEYADRLERIRLSITYPTSTSRAVQ